MIESEARRAAEIILSGGTILYPTDTIWGIGCDATNPEAVKRIYEIKQRSDSKSMLVLMPGAEMLESYLKEVPEKAVEIIKVATKPTTIIYPGAKNLASGLVAEDGSVGIRITSDPFCMQVMELTGLPIVSTSANTSGHPSPGTFAAIESILLEEVDYVVNWRQDEKRPAVPSSIVKIDRQGETFLLRP
ncbi:MAG: L-threonylcarbamoyladenylate synthase [Bacteroidota bacterium]